MSDFKDRLKTEIEELSEKIGKLDSFINGENFKKVDDIQKPLLIIQSSAMQTYLTCLETRYINLN